MNKRFIILIDNTDSDKDDKFIEFVKEEKLGWWHYLNNSWLIKTSKEIRAKDLRDKVREIYNENCLVIEIREDGADTWSGFGPKGENRNMFTWIHKNWK